ncbi:uncharacterized protein MELLADRAFT_89972 [Melampsora larici-populina 98AG31]|uniref:Uncharacterized protein n=1 Tax=Melampsora larici-populina (strain 98AG31 / pathotype 3-4-7) TaxID=747676 RepID=F4RVA5_MELLP|nr:uncharacterized protein MELLADRAFT_89972 [Melampsora larici-populina 98AG31]EGG03700.1 hypothetical protein MELLADRAFT_89972 [Melampsora larici-populina 98AG31]
MGAGGAHRKRRMSYEIQAKGFSHAQFKLKAGNIYYLRGSFFPSNTDKTKDDLLFFEASDRVLIGPIETFSGDLVDSIGVTGVGIVTAIDQMPEPITNGCKPNPADGEKIVTIVTVLHSDYHPISKEPRQCKVQYRIPPTRNLAGTPKILRISREYQFHGFLKDFDEVNFLYVVIASKVSPTTGSKEYEVGAKASNEDNNEVKAVTSKNKPVKFTPAPVNAPFKSPVIATDSESGSNLTFGPADFGPSSFSSASSRPTPGESSNSSDAVNPSLDSGSLGKKRSRAQPKRAGKKAKALDLSLED